MFPFFSPSFCSISGVSSFSPDVYLFWNALILPDFTWWLFVVWFFRFHVFELKKYPLHRCQVKPTLTAISFASADSMLIWDCISALYDMSTQRKLTLTGKTKRQTSWPDPSALPNRKCQNPSTNGYIQCSKIDGKNHQDKNEQNSSQTTKNPNLCNNLPYNYYPYLFLN